MKLNCYITNSVLSFTSNRILYGYYEFKFIDKTINRRYFVNDNEIGHEIFYERNYYNI